MRAVSGWSLLRLRLSSICFSLLKVGRCAKDNVETLQTTAWSNLSGFNLPWRQWQNVVVFLIVQWSVLTHEKDMLSGLDGGPKWLIGS